MTGRTFLAAAAAALLATTALVSTAEAQQRWITFGDSLSDNGNLFAASGGTQPPAPYVNGRFSNGPVWVELLAGPQAGWTGGLTPAGSVNFAFGGSRTDAIATPGPGTATQVGAFFLGGGTIGANDIVTMWAGANDIFQAIAVPANQNTTAMGTVATTAATNVAAQVGQLAAAGARTIIVMNLPDLGGAPQFNTSPASPLASFTVGQYNTVLSAGLANVAAANPNTRILQVNAAALFSVVQANAAAFGFTNVTQQCLTAVACVTGTTAQQNQYLFWDGVHPTAAAHAIVARAATAYLNAPNRALAAAAITEIGVADRRSATYNALERLGDYKAVAGKTDIYISVIGDQGEFGARGAAPGYSYGAGGLQIGVLRHLTNEFTLGGAFSAKTGRATSSGAGDKVEMNPTSFTLDMVARWTSGSGLFVQGAVGSSITRISEFERKLNIGSLTNKGETVSYGASAVAQVGYAIGMGAFSLTPSVKLGYLSSNTRGFRESGAIAPLAYSGRTVGTFVAGGEVKAQFALSQHAAAHVVVGYEAYFGQSGASIRGSIADSPGSNFSRSIGKIESPGFLFGAGVSGLIGAFQTTAEYRGSVGEGGKLQHRGTISGRVGF